MVVQLIGRMGALALPTCLFLTGLGQAALAQSPTRYGSTAELEGDTTCGQGTGGIHTYMETESFWIYVCGDEADPLQPRFYRSFSGDGEPGLGLYAEDYDPNQGRYIIFENDGYQYILDPGNAQTSTAQLIVQDPEGTILLDEVASVYLNIEYLADEDPDLSDAESFGCTAAESEFVFAETEAFYAFICGGDLPHSYVGIAKETGDQIRLPLADYDPQGAWFEAVNGDISYILTPEALQVWQGSEVLLDDPILSWN